MTKRLLAVLALFIFAVPAFADIARPDNTPKQPKKDASIDSRLTIRLEKDAKEARLIIPRSELKELIAQLGTDGQAAPLVKVGGISQAQTIMGGLGISLGKISDKVRQGYSIDRSRSCGQWFDLSRICQHRATA